MGRSKNCRGPAGINTFRHFQVLKRDTLNISLYLDSTLGTVLLWKLQWESGAARLSAVSVICCRAITQQVCSLVPAQGRPSGWTVVAVSGGGYANTMSLCSPGSGYTWNWAAFSSIACFFFLRCKAPTRPHRVNPQCGHVFFHVSPLRPYRGMRVEWPPGLEGHPVDQNGPRLLGLPLCHRCMSVDSRAWAQSPTLRFTTQWGLSGLWMRRGWWRWSGRMEAAVCTPSPGSETTVSVHCAPWTRPRRGSCCCPTLTSTPGSMLSSSPAMAT